jgi:hypothetical protein
VDGQGLPPTVAVTAANVNDSLVFEGLLDDVGVALDGQAMLYVTIRAYYAHAELPDDGHVREPAEPLGSSGISQATTRSAGAAGVGRRIALLTVRAG